MFQKVIIIGNLGGDPEMRYMPSGDAVTNFSVATNRKWNNPDGSKGEETTWFRVAVWGKQAEACNQYLAKGRQVLVEGQLTPDKETGRPRIWTTQDGRAGSSYELRAFNVKFLGGGAGGGEAGGGEAGGGEAGGDEAGGASGTGAAEAPGMTEDEIPF